MVSFSLPSLQMLRCVLPILMAALSSLVLAQPNVPPGIRGPANGMATRSVSAYLLLERALADAVADGNHQAVIRMLADEFEVRFPEGGDATSREDWLKESVRGGEAPARVRDLVVREFDDIAVVSFLLDDSHVAKKQKVPVTRFAVDIWRHSTQQLLVRYVSTPARPARAFSRPSGRE